MRKIVNNPHDDSFRYPNGIYVFDKGLLDPPKVKKSSDVNVVFKGLQLAHESY